MTGSHSKHAPPAIGARLRWDDLPAHISEEIEARLGDHVVSAESQSGGLSPGVAARLTTAGGKRAFIKAVSARPNGVAPGFHRREAKMAGALPPGVPAPRFLWLLDEGGDGWVVLAFEDVDGRQPALPWRADELDRVLKAMAGLAMSLTPSPVARDVAGTASGHFATRIKGWRLLQGKPLPGLDEWSQRNLDRLAALESRAPEAVDGDTLLHFDIRADNVLLTPDRVYFVDWPHARVGAAWVDLLLLAPSVIMQGGPDGEELVAMYVPAMDVEPEALTAALVSRCGFLVRESLLPAPPGLPTLRAFQAAQGRAGREWLRQRTGWE